MKKDEKKKREYKMELTSKSIRKRQRIESKVYKSVNERNGELKKKRAKEKKEKRKKKRGKTTK